MKNYDKSHDIWVSKEDISDDCIHQFNVVQIDTAAKILAKVPVGCHPSSTGYAMSKMMSSMVKQKIVLKDGLHSPKKPSTNKLKKVSEQKAFLILLNLSKKINQQLSVHAELPVASHQTRLIYLLPNMCSSHVNLTSPQ